ncbi:MAG: GNAT family N-acetyltransferase [Thermoplasmata archaeon]
MFRIANLRLRPLERNDLTLVHELENDEQGTLYARGLPLNFKTMDEVIQEYEEDMKKNLRRRFTVETADGKAIGVASIYENPGPMKRAGIGLFLKREYWNSGIGKIVTLALMEMLFYFSNYERVEAWSAEFNKRAHKVLMDNGMVLEGKIRKSLFVSGKYYDWYIFGELKNEYLENREKILKKILDKYYDDYIVNISSLAP